MTCIVGWVENETVWIGGDSAAVADSTIQCRVDTKVWSRDDWVYGFTDSFRFGQLLRYSFKEPPRKKSRDLLEYMVTDYIDAVRRCLKSGGYAEANNGVETGGTFLVGHCGRLFAIYEDYQVGEYINNYAAIGCGESYALGALHVLKNINSNLSGEEIITAALNAVAEHCTGVRKPFHIVHTTPLHQGKNI